jgi:hypothetical protein
MKRDMQKIIVNTARSRTTCSRCGKAGGAIQRSTRRNASRVRDYGLLPRLKSKNLVYGASGDRLNPLRRFLEKRLGQSWNDVWSEICSVNDRRSVTGYHLRLHVEWMVETDPLSVARIKDRLLSSASRPKQFYVEPDSGKLACC